MIYYKGHGKKYEQCLKIAWTWSVFSLVLSNNFLIYMYGATEIEAFVNVNAYFIKLMHINPVLHPAVLITKCTDIFDSFYGRSVQQLKLKISLQQISMCLFTNNSQQQ